ncbi:hypothetical protein FRC00_005216 [Tulasnella sp. 408]|nr:hypothetical protein FRC00_005216 [Tulasnella sp. 408]
MAERPGCSLPSPSKKRQNTVKEEERFDCIKRALPPHLRPGEVPEPLTNLSTEEDERLVLFHQLSDHRLPSDGVANMYFIYGIKQMSINTREFLERFVTAPPPFGPSAKRLTSTFEQKRGGGSQENIPCKAIAFHSFGENLRRTVHEAASSSLDRPTSSRQLPSLSRAHEDHGTSTSPPEDRPLRGIEGPAVGDEVNGRTTARALTGQVEDVSGRHVNFDPDSFVVVRKGPDEYHGAKQECIQETCEQVEAPRHSQPVPDPDEYSENDKSRINSNVPASSSSSTTAKPFSPAPVPSQERPKGVSAPSRSRKGKQQAQEPEETPSRPANVATDLIKARLRVEYDSPYASRIAMNEARQTGISQEQLEPMVKFDESSNGAEKVGGEEGSSGNFGNDQPRARILATAKFEHQVDFQTWQTSSKPPAQPWPSLDFPPKTAGGAFGDAQPSPPSREASPASTDTGSYITYDDGVQDDEQDMGGTSGGVSDVVLWNILISSSVTPHCVPGRTRNKAARPPPAQPSAKELVHHRQEAKNGRRQSTADPDSMQRMSLRLLSQNRVRNSRRDLISTPRQPLRRRNTDPSLRSDPTLKARSMVDGIPLPGLRPSDSIPEEEATEVPGSNSIGMVISNLSVPDRAGDTEDDGRETEPRFDQIPSHIDIEPPRFLPRQRRSERRRGNVGMSRELGVEAEAVELAEAAKGRTDLVASASPIPPASSTNLPAPAEATNGNEQKSSSETPRLLISNLTDTRGLDFPSLSYVFALGIDIVKTPVGRFGKRDHVITFVEDGSAGGEASGASSGADEGGMKRLYRKLDINPTFVEIESM